MHTKQNAHCLPHPVQYRPSVQKFFMIFFNTDAQMDRWTNQLNTPLPSMGTGGIFLYPIFLPLTKQSELALLTHSVLFG